jgi:hypothetical protein
VSGILEVLMMGAFVGPYGLRVKHDPTEHPPKGAFRYRGYDRGGILIIRGWLLIDRYGSSEVVGEWCLDKIGEPDDTGPQIGRGSLHGDLEGAQLRINLNPGFAHFNVSLTGAYNGASFIGVWRYATSRRTVSEGTFEAVSIDNALIEHP